MYKVDQQPPRKPPLMPFARQPKPSEFFVGTWSGRLILLNTVFFIVVSLHSQQIVLPSVETLLFWGAKDPVLISQGEYWRLLSPVVLHAGILHFAFNNWALYSLGYQIEHILGAKWFLILYLIAGIGGNVLSNLTSLSPGVGASSSLFGLLGVGVYLERLIARKQLGEFGEKKGSSVYLTMLVVNLAIGFMIPQIDNAAHIGGLLSGIVIGYAWTRVHRTRVAKFAPKTGVIGLVSLVLVIITIAGVGSSKTVLSQRLWFASNHSSEPVAQNRYLTKIVELSPDDLDARLLRLELSLKYGNYTIAETDLTKIVTMAQGQDALLQLSKKFHAEGNIKALTWLERRKKELGTFF